MARDFFFEKFLKKLLTFYSELYYPLVVKKGEKKLYGKNRNHSNNYKNHFF